MPRGLIRSLLLVAPISVLAFVSSQAIAQSSVTLTVAARIIAPCTITSSTLQSSCPEQTLAQQSDIRNGSARITRSGDETAVTHQGGQPPTIEKVGDRLSISF